jgi:hypothetical protein
MPIAMQPLHLSRNVFGGLALVSVVYWGMQVWQWSAPLQPLQPVAVQQAAGVQSQWAGLLVASQGIAGSVSEPLSQWQLLGVVSTQAEQGIAMLRSPSGEELLVRTGQQLAPGLVLKLVADDFVQVAMPSGQVGQLKVK